MALREVDKIYPTKYAFAAILKDGKVVTGGSKHSGGDSNKVQAALIGVDKIFFTENAFAVVMKDGTTRHVCCSLEEWESGELGRLGLRWRLKYCADGVERS